MIAISAATVRRVLDEHPNLAAGGFHTHACGKSGRCCPAAAGGPDRQAEREYLLDARGLDEIQRCVDWLAQATPTAKATRSSPSSYEIKHVIEEATGRYVSNGAAIVAALLTGVPTRPGDRAWYVHIGLARRQPHQARP